MTLAFQPEHLEAELSVLGAMLLDPTCTDDVLEVLEPGAFAHEKHRLVFDAFQRVHRAGVTIDPVTVQSELARGDALERAGGLDFLAMLQDVVPTSANVLFHAGIIRERALERRLVQAGHQIADVAAKRIWQGPDLVAQVERIVSEATAAVKVGQPEKVGAGAERVFKRVDSGASHTLLGIPSGLRDLDELTAGWRDGDYVILGARPSGGKTALALHCAMMAAKAGVSTLFVSLEMGKDALVVRMLAAESGLNSRNIERGRLQGNQYAHLYKAQQALDPLPLWIDDQPSRTVGSVRALTRRMHRTHGIRLMILDYVQLVHGDNREENKQQEMRMVSAGLKALGRELQIPVIVCAQLSRAFEQRGDDARPKLSDLKESGALEQDADVVLMNWRDPKKTEKVAAAVSDGNPPLTIVLGKQRNGPTGDVDVFFDPATGRFQDWSRR